MIRMRDETQDKIKGKAKNDWTYLNETTTNKKDCKWFMIPTTEKSDFNYFYLELAQPAAAPNAGRLRLVSKSTPSAKTSSMALLMAKPKDSAYSIEVRNTWTLHRRAQQQS